MSDALPRKKSALARYQGMMISIAVFVFLISAILALNSYASNRIARDTVEMNAAAQMRDMVQTMTRDLFNLKLSWGEDPNSPHIQTTLKRLGDNTNRFESSLNAFAKGGTIVGADGNNINISAVSGVENQKHLTETQTEWVLFGQLIKDYLKVARDVTADSTTLDLAVDQAQSSSNVIYNAMEQMAKNIEQGAARQAGFLKMLQIGGILFAILYFVLFIFYFVRKLREADEAAEEARRETAEIMATVKEGLFLVDKDLTIGSQYSSELENIIGQRHIGGKTLLEILEAMVSKDDLEVTRGFVNQLFNKRTKANLISDLNPLAKIKVEVDDFGGFHVSRYLDFKFSRVYYGKEIERVLVSVSDITSAVNLEERLAQEREQSDQQIEMLATILNTDAALLQGFTVTVRNCVNRVNATLKEPGRSTTELHAKLRDIYREIHSMKGEASALKLHGFVTIADSFEEKLKQLQNTPNITGNDFLPLTVMLDELVNVFNTVERLAKRIGILGDGTPTAALSPQQPVATQDGRVMQHYFESFAADMAKRNNKQIHLVCRGMDDAGISPQAAATLKEISIQLLRNAVVHGIEAPAIRVHNGKPEAGQIQLLLSRQHDGSAELVVEDDGGGINFDGIRKKAVEMGRYSAAEAQNLDKKDLLKLMFSSGFSTASSSSEDAGRGVGMDVIKDRVQSLNGNLKVASVPGQYTRFTISMPLK
ncbi:MAG: ATP-binding protein [Neisseria sp.]|nr:ATP-binding protein [Neisseria sp.]